MKRSSAMKGLGLLALFVVIVIALFLVFRLTESFLARTEQSPGNLCGEEPERISLDGIRYTPKKHLETVLLMGIDSRDPLAKTDRSSRQTDFMAVLIVDKAEERFQLLHLNRDTMTEIPRLDMEGKKIGTYRGQLTLAHTYGATEKQRCRNAVDAVQSLLYGTGMDHYILLTMGAVPILTDSVGGVEVRLLDDFTFLDPSYVRDAVVTLKGEQALRYVQERGALEDSSNLRRMERQQQYIGALFGKLAAGEPQIPEDLADTVMDVSEYIASDCTVDQLSRLFERISAYRYDGVVTIAGETKVSVDGYMEFHADEADIQRKVVELFYQPEKTE